MADVTEPKSLGSRPNSPNPDACARDASDVKDGGQPKCPQWLLLWEFSPFQLLCLLRLLHVFLGDVGVPVLLPSTFLFASVPSYWQREDRTPVLHFHFQVTETVTAWLLFEPELERQFSFLRKLYSQNG